MTDFLAWVEDYQEKLDKSAEDPMDRGYVADLYWKTALVLAIAQQLSRIATALETIAEHSAEHNLRERKRG